MAWRFPVLLAAALGGGVLLLHLHSDQPEYDPEQLVELRQIFERSTEPIRRGQLSYSLPEPAVAQRELAYLNGLAELLEVQPPDCVSTEQALLERHATYLAKARASIFLQAHQIWAKRQDQDFVHDLSDEVSIGRTVAVRSTTPTDTDKKLAMLRERTARIELVEAGLGALARLARAAEAFGAACPLESGALHTALGIFGN